ncbi:MAG: hypothetical protein ACFFEA_07780 [Candidatus Thorarchaeota archaeon]
MELVSLLLGVILVILQILLNPGLPTVSAMLNGFNILVTIFVWVSYKIARIKMAIDLRLWIIVVAFQLFTAFPVVVGMWFLSPFVPSEYSGWLSLAKGFLPFLVVVLSSGYGNLTVRNRWLRLVQHKEELHIQPADVLYLPQKVGADVWVYIYGMFCVIAIATLVPESVEGILGIVFLLALILIPLGIAYDELKRAQTEILQRWSKK